MWPFSRQPVVPVLRFSGPIGMATPLRPGLTLAAYAGAIEKAFSVSKLPAVAVVINSPGGSPVQSNLLFKRIRQMADEKKKRVYVFCEDVAASGGYFLAIAGDEIYADPSSIIGSIGVVSRSFGFVDLLARSRRRAARLHGRRRTRTSSIHSFPKIPMTSRGLRRSSRMCTTYSSASSRNAVSASSRRRTGTSSRAPSGRRQKLKNSA